MHDPTIMDLDARIRRAAQRINGMEIHHGRYSERRFEATSSLLDRLAGKMARLPAVTIPEIQAKARALTLANVGSITEDGHPAQDPPAALAWSLIRDILALNGSVTP